MCQKCAIRKYHLSQTPNCGEIFGTYTIIKSAEWRKTEHDRETSMCLTRCRCGIKKWIAVDVLRSDEVARCRNCGFIGFLHVGRRFGRLKIIGRSTGEIRTKGYLCRCDCGNTRNLDAHELTSGHSTQCRKCADRNSHRIKGLDCKISEHPLYNIWRRILSYCERYNLKVQKSWNKGMFVQFTKDVGAKPIGKSLVLRNRENGFTTNNVQWIDIRKLRSRTEFRRSRKWLSPEDVKQIVDAKSEGRSQLEIAKKHGITVHTVSHLTSEPKQQNEEIRWLRKAQRALSNTKRFLRDPRRSRSLAPV